MRQDIPLNIYSERRITNPNFSSAGDKLQFFGSCLDVMCFRTGQFYHYEAENHISLLDHLIFIADSTLNHRESGETKSFPKYCFLQIVEICKSHPLLSMEDIFLNEKEDRKTKVLEFIQKISSERIERNPNTETILNSIENIKNYLVKIRELLLPKYFSSVVAILYNRIACKHTLNYHKKDFEYLARLFFSVYYYQEYSREMINTFVRRILENKIQVENHCIYTEAFLPLELYKRQINNNRFGKILDLKLLNEIQNYLQNRTLKKQIEAFSYILEYEKYEYQLLFRLEGLVILGDKNDKELNVLGLKIMQINDFVERYNDYDFENSKDFFKNSFHSGLVEIKIKAYSQVDAVFKALSELEIKLGKIMRTTNTRFSINRKYYTCFEKFEKRFWVNTMPEIGKISTFSIDDLNKFQNRISKSPHRDFFMELELILQKGYLEEDLDSSMHYYRKFIEILTKRISSTNITHSDLASKEINELAFLLLYFEKNRYCNETRIWAHNRLLNTNILDLNNENKINIYINKVRKNKKLLSYKETLSIMGDENLHTKYELNRAMNFKKQVDMKSAFNYYTRQLAYIKHYRDKHQHANVSDEMVARKLGVSAYRLLNQLLKDIFYTVDKKENRENLLGDTLREMINTSVVLLNTH